MPSDGTAPTLAVRLGLAAPTGGLALTGDALLALAVTAVAQALALGLQLLLARGLGPSEFGAFSIAIAWLGIGVMLAKGGLDTAVVRLVAGFRAGGETDRMTAAFRFARRSVVATGVVLGAAALTAGVLGAPHLPSTRLVLLAVAALVLPVAACSELHAAALRGLRRIVLAVAGDGIVRPLATAVLVLLAWLVLPGARTAEVALGAWLAGTALAAVVTGLGLRAVAAPAAPRPPRPERQAWRRLGLALMVANGALVAMYAIDPILLGLLASATEAGLFSVAARVALFVLFVMNAAQLAGGPRIAAAVARNDRVALRSLVRTMNRLAIAAALPIGLTLAVGAELLLGLFGPAFPAAGGVLRIIVVAQLINVLTGPTGVLLSMGGRERELAVLVAGGLALHVVLACWLIPRLGLDGAALAGLGAHTAWNAVAVWRVRRAFGIDPTVGNLLERDA